MNKQRTIPGTGGKLRASREGYIRKIYDTDGRYLGEVERNSLHGWPWRIPGATTADATTVAATLAVAAYTLLQRAKASA